MHEKVPIPIRCLMVDDEPLAREVIRRYIEQMPTLQLVDECSNAIQALTILQRQSIDLIFLDILLPQLNGIEFLKTLKTSPRVIFTTAHPQYALEGYEFDVVDYLLKPVRFDRFLKAVNKAFPIQNSKQLIEQPFIADENKKDSFVYFRAERKMVKIFLKDILYIESMKDYIKIITTHGTVITKQSISSVEAMLPEKQFLRIHRSYIVSVSKIMSFTNESIETEKAEIPIGKLYRNVVLKVLS